MPKKSPKTAKHKSPWEGRWRIVWMEQWEQDYLDEDVEAYLEFKPHGRGFFQFGYVSGEIDYRLTTRDGNPAAEFSWEGGDGADGTPLTGRGWAALGGKEISGMICIHLGDESPFRAIKK